MTPSAYFVARDRGKDLWNLLLTEDDPSERQALFRDLGSVYRQMASACVPDDVPDGYDGDFTADLVDLSALCWVMAASEEALASREWTAAPLENIPGADAGSPLAAAWERFWQTRDRANRARLMYGRPGGPGVNGELPPGLAIREPVGIIPLMAAHAGSLVLDLLRAVADAEGSLGELFSMQTAAP